MLRRRSDPDPERSVARQVMGLQVLVVVLLVLVSIGLAAYDARSNARSTATERAVSVARAVADSPTVGAALATADPTTTLQPYAEQVRTDADVDFVVVMDLDHLRFTHPHPARIGERFVGGVGDAPRGEVFTEQFTGTLGPSVRAVVPVVVQGRVVALVAVGIIVERVQAAVTRSLLPIGLAAVAVLGAGLLGAWLISRRLRRQTHGLGEREITRMYEYYRAVLHAVREGLLLLDPEGRVQLVNDEARRLLELGDDVVGRRVEDLGLPPALVEASRDEVGAGGEDTALVVAGGRMLVVGRSPAVWEGRDVGSVVTLRDRSELAVVTGELDAVRSFSEALRSQNHEAANRLHTVVSLVELGRPDEAVAFATEGLRTAQHLADRVVHAVQDPVLSALLLGKSAEAAERGVALGIDAELPASVPLEPLELVTVVGNLIDNALDAVAGQERREVLVTVQHDDSAVSVQVDDSGPGVPLEVTRRILERGWSSKDDDGRTRGLGLALVHQIALRHHGDVRVTDSPLGGARVLVELEIAP